MSETFEEQIVLLDQAGNAIGTREKLSSHHSDTPLHLAFSCYLFNDKNELLVTRRAESKKVFPGIWTNSVCGHPAPGETFTSAVRRRAMDELGLEIESLQIAIPDFAYRAEYLGIVENEICPVFFGFIHSDPTLNESEVCDFEWVPWTDYAKTVHNGQREVSPWSRLQVESLILLGEDTHSWESGDSALLPPAAKLS